MILLVVVVVHETIGKQGPVKRSNCLRDYRLAYNLRFDPVPLHCDLGEVIIPLSILGSFAK